MADLFGTLRQLRAQSENVKNLDDEHLKTLRGLGLVELSTSAWTDAQGRRTTTASLTPQGHKRLAELDTEGADRIASPGGPRGRVSDDALMALRAISNGKDADSSTVKALINTGLAVRVNGKVTLTSRGGHMLESAWAHERLQSILSPYKRG